MKSFNFFDLVGKTITSTNVETGDSAYTFTLSDGSVVSFEHYQDCCEQVRVHAVNGDPNQLLNKQIVFAEEDNHRHPSVGDMSGSELEIVWLGESNGCYDESVSVSIQKDTP